ncbi:MAG: single-stranded-DNA-specific exonuclease RecJ [Oscillospiraceae bacterium]|nr:single-stranded-DNA-specific exonuclease RecJ [Oscillospiraceae bacterium]
MKKWIIGNPDPKISGRISSGSDLTPLCADVLVSRGITDLKAAAELIRTESLEDPFVLKDMKKAAEIIDAAVEEEKKICIYGDYDCDGITSTVMLYSYLECIGADVSCYIPERSEGYGLNEDSVRKMADDGTQLVITVDNGISALAEARLIRELGMDLIVTDHHQPGEELPEALAVVNPHQKDCPSSFKPLCGAGVVLKLIAALEGGDYDSASEQFGDLAAIGTVADIVSLTGENRYIVENGLMMIRNTERCGLIELMKLVGLIDENGECRPVTAETVAFTIAPRINASGRFGSPSQAFRLLMCDDPDEAAELASELNELNTERKAAEEEITSQIFSQINEHPELLYNRILVFSGENWHHGVIGIVASKMLEKYGKPCFIITEEGDTARGSARAFGEFSVFECLSACESVLLRFGGHKGAGGFSLSISEIENFRNKIQKYAADVHEAMPAYTLRAEKILLPADITVKNVSGLGILEPFGQDNEKPYFAVAGAIIDEVIPLSGGAHTKLRLNYGGSSFYALLFRTSADDMMSLKGQKYDFIVTLGINSFRGNETVDLQVADFRKSGIKQEKFFAAEEAYEKYRRGEELPEAYYQRMCPEREELIKVYTSLTDKEIMTEQLYMKTNPDAVNICKLRICLDVFSELGLVRMDYAGDRTQRLKVDKKSNLEDSQILRGLRSKWKTRAAQ